MNTNKTIAELEAEYFKDFSLKSWNALNNARFLEQKKNKVVEKKRKNKKQWDKK
jgi:hypothetical protein